MSAIRVLSVPYELGRLREGVGRGADALLAGGAEAALASAGAAVRTTVIELDDRWASSGHGDVDASFALIRAVADGVRRAREDGALPVVLGGSCFLSVGVTAGLAEPSPAVVWLDAHADFNHPDTSQEGYFDGMGLSVLTGGAWQGMLAAVPGARPVAEDRVVLAGARDFDAPEEARLRASRVVHLGPSGCGRRRRSSRRSSGSSPSRRGSTCTSISTSSTRGSPPSTSSASPGASTPTSSTPWWRRSPPASPVRALSLTCYDPSCDAGARVPPIAMRVLRTVARSR